MSARQNNASISKVVELADKPLCAPAITQTTTRRQVSPNLAASARQDNALTGNGVEFVSKSSVSLKSPQI